MELVFQKQPRKLHSNKLHERGWPNIAEDKITFPIVTQTGYALAFINYERGGDTPPVEASTESTLHEGIDNEAISGSQPQIPTPLKATICEPIHYLPQTAPPSLELKSILMESFKQAPILQNVCTPQKR
ncbi:unnamed protein product [Hymenolepis diminuta]|uniref:Uncharacterized protein n=1 Tax=Hymenolepis diminuta TaxID=6216 RepID=A0A564ZC20_HYMDI|nr:unnamed protein product [Hymenolepis diminuta]